MIRIRKSVVWSLNQDQNVTDPEHCLEKYILVNLALHWSHKLGSSIAVAAVAVQYSLHRVEEGHVGVYFRGGAMLQVYCYSQTNLFCFFKDNS